jgi:hypothetical protein
MKSSGSEIVTEVGFIHHPTIEWTGASPDGLVGDDGLIEIKCPNTATHIDYLLRGAVPAKYQPQMLWQMACTGRKWCDFASYDPRMPVELQLFVVRFERDDLRIKEAETEVIAFLGEVESTVKALERLIAGQREKAGSVIQGTASLLSLAASLRESREKVANFHGRQDAMRDMEQAADALERLAHLEPDLEVEHGTN